VAEIGRHRRYAAHACEFVQVPPGPAPHTGTAQAEFGAPIKPALAAGKRRILPPRAIAAYCIQFHSIRACRKIVMIRYFLSAAVALLSFVPVAGAQNYPERAITLVVPYPAGAITDLLARDIADRLSKKYGQSVVVDNKGGASGNIGSEFVARAQPDGYTLLLTTNAPLVLNKYFIKMPFDPYKDLQPIIATSEGPNALVVASNVPVANVAEFIAYAKANPGKLSFASSGVGSPHHFDGEYLKDVAGIDMTHVPYRGAAPAVNDIVAGQIPAGIISYGNIVQFARDGKVKVLGLIGDTRSPLAPDVPLVAESVRGFVAAPNGWNAILAPAGTPPGIVAKLNKDLNEVLKEPELKARMAASYYSPIGGPPEQLTAKMKKESEVADRLAAKMGLAAK
jgi:tripartite-type tricarboxylate transporter receptor subunit TctC